MRGRPYTEEDDEVLRTKISTREAAEKLGRTMRSIESRRRKIGVKNYPYELWTDEEILRLFDTSKSDEELAKELGRGIWGIKRKRLELNIKRLRCTTWLPHHDAFLIKNIHRPIEQIALVLERKVTAVQKRIYILRAKGAFTDAEESTRN